MASINVPWGKQPVSPKQEKPEEKPELKEWTPKPVTPPPNPPEVQIKESVHKCPNCGADVADERTVLLNTLCCAKCTPQASKPMGVMNFDHKTGGVLMLITDKKIFRILKKPINQQR